MANLRPLRIRREVVPCGALTFLLGSLRFTSPYFLTFLQAKELGGHVRKGEHGSLVVKYGTYTKQEDNGSVSLARVP